MTDSGHDSSASHDAIAAATKQWEDAFNRGDAAAIAANMSPDARLMPPNGDFVDGREAIQAFWQAFIDMKVGVRLEELELTVAGDMGYKVGKFFITDAEGADVDNGKFLELWRFMDGEWQFHRDIWNSSVPVPQE